MASFLLNELQTKPRDHPLATAQKDAVDHVRNALTENAFTNGKLLRPRQLSAIARAQVEAFLHYTRASDDEGTRQKGKELADQGLGHRSILMMAEALRKAGNNGLGSDEKAVSGYVAALLEGYMVGREQDLLQQQSRTLQALIRVRAKNNGS
jgi:hypothetical protein